MTDELPVRALGVIILGAVGAWIGSMGGVLGALAGFYSGYSLSSKLVAPALPETYRIPAKYQSPHHIFKDISPPFEEKQSVNSESKHSWLFKDL